MAGKLTLRQLKLEGASVLMRVDFNVPSEPSGKIIDDWRIVAALPTIRYVSEQGSPLVLISHSGRPKGKREGAYSLAPCADRLSELLGKKVKMAEDCIGRETETLKKQLAKGEILLLENLRFHPGEEHPKEYPLFAEELSGHMRAYVNEAFASSHREHASVTTVAGYFPGRAAMGFLMEKEIEFLHRKLRRPKRPFAVIAGGAKISSKIKQVKELFCSADILLVGGAMAHTFLQASGRPIGNSFFEADSLSVAEEILRLRKERGLRTLLPVDLVVTSDLSRPSSTEVISLEKGISFSGSAGDIGPKTRTLFKKALDGAETVFWNGPLGMIEKDVFGSGSRDMAEYLADSAAVTVIGGGDTASVIRKWHLEDKMDHLSTGGGASLEYIEKGTLPGIDALSDERIKS